jgi:hypothetical protein
MMYNDRDRPELARGSQDVEEPPKRSKEHVQFTGRGMPVDDHMVARSRADDNAGGVANAVIPAVEENNQLQRNKSNMGQPTSEQQQRTSSKERPKEVPGKSA